MSKIAAIIGRLLIGLLFIASGIGKLMNLSIPAAMLAGAGLPTNLALPVAVFELVAGLCLAAGFAVRLASALLAVFTAATILFFHHQFNDPAQGFEALKNAAIIGGLALAFAHSQMWSHYYSIKTARSGELATRDAERRVHEAELRAARAEATAEAVRTGIPAAPYTDTHTDGYVETPVRRRSRWFDW
jgi:putative oxidoreductase